MAKKTTKKAASKQTKPDGMELVLEGDVFLLDTRDGKTTKEKIDGELVLRCVMLAIQQGLSASK